MGAWWEARSFLLSLQVGCDGAADDRGAIAYSADGYDSSTAARATAQAVPGITGTSLAALSSAGSRSSAPELACR